MTNFKELLERAFDATEKEMILDPSLKIRMEQTFGLEDGMMHSQCAEKILDEHDRLIKRLNKSHQLLRDVLKGYESKILKFEIYQNIREYFKSVD
jgi:hypothetical protein